MKLSGYRYLCQKNEEENYLLDKLIFRRISIFLTIILIKFRIRPNQATLLSLLSSLASLYFLTFNSRREMLIAAFLILLYYLLDHSDGELARYYQQTGVRCASLAGQYFDVLVHRYSSNLMVFFIGISIYRAFGYFWALLLGFAACIGISSFPNMMAAQVVAGRVARDREKVFSDEKMTRILQILERKQGQIKAVHGRDIRRKLRKLAGEILFFPGHIILLIIVLIADAYLAPRTVFGRPCNLRLLLLLFFTVIFLLKTVVQSIIWIRRLKEIT